MAASSITASPIPGIRWRRPWRWPAEHRIVGEIRTFGVLAAIELVKSKDGPEMFEDTGATGVICRDHAINRGLMMRAVRDAMILSPALTYSRADIDETVRIAAQALDATADQLGL